MHWLCHIICKHDNPLIPFQDVLVVTINYRLGALGFLSVPSANIHGNYGLLDQQMALKWIRRYIHSFGGDPNKITLMGWSAGSSSVATHIFAETSAGLFHRAIMMSGTFTNPWATNTGSDKCAESLLHQLSVADVNVSRLKIALQHIDANLFVRNVTQQLVFKYLGHIEYCFIPTMDINLNSKSSELSLDFLKPSNAVPLMIGFTSLEVASDFPYGFQFENVNFPMKDKTFLQKLDTYLQTKLKDPFGDDTLRKNRRLEFLSHLRRLVDSLYGIWKFGLDYGTKFSKKVFMYRFSYDGHFNYFKSFVGLTNVGAVHGDDLGYLSGNYKLRDVESRLVNESLVRSRNVQMWTNFAKFG